jgi:hypothetical protein
MGSTTVAFQRNVLRRDLSWMCLPPQLSPVVTGVHAGLMHGALIHGVKSMGHPPAVVVWAIHIDVVVWVIHIDRWVTDFNSF